MLGADGLRGADTPRSRIWTAAIPRVDFAPRDPHLEESLLGIARCRTRGTSQ